MDSNERKNVSFDSCNSSQKCDEERSSKICLDEQSEYDSGKVSKMNVMVVEAEVHHSAGITSPLPVHHGARITSPLPVHHDHAGSKIVTINMRERNVEGEESRDVEDEGCETKQNNEEPICTLRSSSEEKDREAEINDEVENEDDDSTDVRNLEFINRQLSILNEESGELATPIHKSNKQKRQDMIKKEQELAVKRKSGQSPYRSPYKKFSRTPTRGVKRSPGKPNLIRSCKRKKLMMGNKGEEKGSMDDNEADSEHSDDSDDNWQIIEDSDTEIDKTLEENASKNKLTAFNVKTILHQVITNEHVIAMVKNTLMNELEQMKEAVYEPKMTRSKVKQVIQETGDVVHPWPLSPLKQKKEPVKSFLDLELSEEEEEEDTDYNPDKEKEQGSFSDDDSESMASSQLSDFGSPAPSTPVTPLTPRTPASSVTSASDLDRTPNVRGDGDQTFLSPMGPPSKLPIYRKSLGQRFQDAMDENDKRQEEQTIAKRTRSKLSLEDTSIIEIELTFVPPDFTPDMYDTQCHDADWNSFLQSLYKPPESENTNDGMDDEEKDPEYNYQDEIEDLIDSDEELRDDRAVKISKKEMNELIDELYDYYQGTDEIEEKDKIQMKVKAKSQFKRQATQIHTAECNENPQFMMNDDLREQLGDQMRKHVQLLTQTYVSAQGNQPDYSEVAEHSRKLLVELNHYCTANMLCMTPNSAYNAANLKDAIDLIKRPIEWEQMQRNRPNKKSSLYLSSEKSIASLLVKNYHNLSRKKKDLILDIVGDAHTKGVGERLQSNRLNIPHLTQQQKHLIWTSPVFMYPELVPSGGFVFQKDLEATYRRLAFTDAEDNLIALGLEQFQNLPYVHSLIRKFLLPVKTTEQIRIRIKNLVCSKSSPNLVKYFRQFRKLPEFPRYTGKFSALDLKMPRDQNVQNLPTWCKELKIREIMAASDEQLEKNGSMQRSQSVNIPIECSDHNLCNEEKSNSAPATPMTQSSVVNKPQARVAVRKLTPEKNDFSFHQINVTEETTHVSDLPPTMTSQIIHSTSVIPNNQSESSITTSGSITKQPDSHSTASVSQSKLSLTSSASHNNQCTLTSVKYPTQLVENNASSTSQRSCFIPVSSSQILDIVSSSNMSHTLSANPSLVSASSCPIFTSTSNTFNNKKSYSVSSHKDKDNALRNVSTQVNYTPLSEQIIYSHISSSHVTNTFISDNDNVLATLPNQIITTDNSVSNTQNKIDMNSHSTGDFNSENQFNTSSSGISCPNIDVVCATNSDRKSQNMLNVYTEMKDSSPQGDQSMEYLDSGEDDTLQEISQDSGVPKFNDDYLSPDDITPTVIIRQEKADLKISSDSDKELSKSPVSKIKQHNSRSDSPNRLRKVNTLPGFIPLHKKTGQSENLSNPASPISVKFVESVPNPVDKDRVIGAEYSSGTELSETKMSGTKDHIHTDMKDHSQTENDKTASMNKCDRKKVDKSEIKSILTDYCNQQDNADTRNMDMGEPKQMDNMSNQIDNDREQELKKKGTSQLEKDEHSYTECSPNVIKHDNRTRNETTSVISPVCDGQNSDKSENASSDNLDVTNSVKNVEMLSKDCNHKQLQDNQEDSSHEKVQNEKTESESNCSPSPNTKEVIDFDITSQKEDINEEKEMHVSPLKGIPIENSNTLSISSLQTGRAEDDEIFVKSAPVHSHVIGSLSSLSASQTKSAKTASPMKSALEIIASYSSLMLSPKKGQSKSQKSQETTPVKNSASRYRPLAPKPLTSPIKIVGPLGIPHRSPRKSPRRQQLQRKAQAICPKGLIIKTAVSPSKKAASQIMNKVLGKKHCRILPRPPGFPKNDLQIRTRSYTRQEENYLSKDETETEEESMETASECDTVESEYLSDDVLDDAGDEGKKCSARKNLQKKFHKKREPLKSAESDDTEAEDNALYDSQLEDEIDDEDHLAELMAASTTIRFNPKNVLSKDSISKDSRSKTKKRKDATLAILAPNIIEADPQKDDRDTAFAQAYLTKAAEALKDYPRIYEQFLKILYEFGQSEQSPIKLYRDMKLLLQNFPDLVQDFSAFLLPSQAVECGCFMENQEFIRARTFLRKLEVYFERHPSHYQKVMKILTKFSLSPKKEAKALREMLEPVLKSQSHLMEELSLFFDDEKPPDSYMTEFEEITLGDSDEDEGIEFDGFEEVTVPEDENPDGTKKCMCTCHQNPRAQNYHKRNIHCYNCCLKVIDGELYYRINSKVIKKVRVKYHTPSKGTTPKDEKITPPPKTEPVDWEEDEGAEKENVQILKPKTMGIKLKISSKKKGKQGRFFSINEFAESPVKSSKSSKEVLPDSEIHSAEAPLDDAEGISRLEHLPDLIPSQDQRRQDPSPVHIDNDVPMSSVNPLSNGEEFLPESISKQKEHTASPKEVSIDTWIQETNVTLKTTQEKEPVCAFPPPNQESSSTDLLSKAIREAMISESDVSMDSSIQGKDPKGLSSALSNQTFSIFSDTAQKSDSCNFEEQTLNSNENVEEATSHKEKKEKAIFLEEQKEDSFIMSPPQQPRQKTGERRRIVPKPVTDDKQCTSPAFSLSNLEDSTAYICNYSDSSQIITYTNSPVVINEGSNLSRLSVSSSQSTSPCSKDKVVEIDKTVKECEPNLNKMPCSDSLSKHSSVPEDSQTILSSVVGFGTDQENDSNCSYSNASIPSLEKSKERKKDSDSPEEKWTKDDDRIILECVKNQGPGFKTFEDISKRLQGKSANQVVERFHTLLEMLAEEETPSEEDTTEEDKSFSS